VAITGFAAVAMGALPWALWALLEVGFGPDGERPEHDFVVQTTATMAAGLVVGLTGVLLLRQRLRMRPHRGQAEELARERVELTQRLKLLRRARHLAAYAQPTAAVDAHGLQLGLRWAL
jgi:hypothetical protein